MSEQNVELARQAYSAFNRGDISVVLEVLDPRIEWHMSEVFARGERVFRGHDGVREVFAIFAENFDDWRTDPEEFIDAGDHVVVPVRIHGIPKGGSDEVEYRLVQVWQAEGSRAVRLDVYSTKEDALAAVGGD